jgi:hypothetical protein
LTIFGLSHAVRRLLPLQPNGVKSMRRYVALAVLLVIVLLALVQFGPSVLFGG